MSKSIGPEIAVNGLVFYYDASNTKKSWKGAPTVNLTPDLNLIGYSGGGQAIILNYIGLEDGWKKYGMGGTWTAGTYPYSLTIDTVAFAAGVSYSTNCYIKTNVPKKFNTFGTGMNYVNKPMNNGGTSFTELQPDGSLRVGRIGFSYTSAENQPGYILSMPIADGTVFNPLTDFVYIRAGQVEALSFFTPYVTGTRTDSQAVIDLTGNNTITQSNITFNTDGSFEWGSTVNARLTAPAIPKYNFGTGDFTFECWIKPTTLTGYQHLVAFPDQTVLALKAWNGLVYLWCPSINTKATIPTWAIAINVWNCITVVRNTGVVYAYANGILIGSTPGFITNFSSNILNIGNGSTNEYLPKKINNVKIYNRALSSLEVNKNFNAHRGVYGL